jgi:hypothetical protein
MAADRVLGPGPERVEVDGVAVLRDGFSAASA